MEALKKSFMGYFQEKGVSLSKVSESKYLVNIGGAIVNYNCFISVYEASGYVLLNTLFPLRVPEEKKADIAKLVLYLNDGEIFGQIVFDVSSGSLSYRSGSFVQLQNGRESKVYDYLLMFNIGKADNHISLFAQVLYGNLDVDAYCRQEQDGDSGSKDDDSDFSCDPSLN
jgi:hypothetical protein